jgi:hypothetical protein
MKIASAADYQRLTLQKVAWTCAVFVFTMVPAARNVMGQVDLNDLTSLEMAAFDSAFHHITIPSTGQLLTRIGQEVWQGNANVYHIDPTITSPNDPRRAGHYWSQFLMIGNDPADGQYFLTDRVESEGETLQSFEMIHSSGKVIEYQGTWTFRNLFTTTARHWVWVEGDDHYHRVQVSLDVLSPINDVRGIWTEWFNVADAWGTVTVQTRDDGIQSQSALGTTNQHHLGQYEMGRDDWLAFTDPQIGQQGSVARVLLSSTSDIRTDDEVTPVLADTTLFDNIELHIHRQVPTGVTLNPGTSFFMDNLVIMNPTTNNTDWINPKIERAKEWIDLFGPQIAGEEVDPGDPTNKFFVPPGGVGNWDSGTSWNPVSLPDANDTAYIHANRTATINSNVGTVGRLILGDLNSGTLHIESGGQIVLTDRALLGIGAGANSAHVVQTGGSFTIAGADPAMFLAFDEDDTATYTISGGELTVGNLWFRFGNGTMTQTGGTVTAGALILGEGGGESTESLYELRGGTLNVSGRANIGKAAGGDDPFPNSDGRMLISGGIATFGDLFFGIDPTDTISLSGTGILRINQSNYIEDYAYYDIGAGYILGSNIEVSTVDIDGVLFTQITSFTGLAGDYNGDGFVDAADYTVWRNNLGAGDETPISNNGDGMNGVDANDYVVWKSNYGNASGGSGGLNTAAVPEPATSLLLMIAALAWCVSHRAR